MGSCGAKCPGVRAGHIVRSIRIVAKREPLGAYFRWILAKLGDGGVRALAGEHGFTAEKATMRDCWRLIDEAGNRIKHPLTGSTAFTVSELAAFLKTLRSDE